MSWENQPGFCPACKAVVASGWSVVSQGADCRDGGCVKRLRYFKTRRAFGQ